MALDFNIEPFYDDYSEDKKYYRILFRPGYAVQARELTQLQTIIQQQIKRHGDHIFKNGSMVIPGQVAYDTNTPYVAIEDTISGGDISSSSIFSEIEGKVFVGQTSGTEAIVLTTAPRDGVEPNTLYVKYTKSGTSSKFLTSEVISPIDGAVGQDLRVADLGGAEFGTGSTASIEKGVYYIKDHFVLCDADTVIISKYTSTPSVKVGLKVIEEFRYPEEDESLLDNALGSPNYAAPGAARYYINLQLTSVSLDAAIDSFDFIPLLTLSEGKVQFLVDKTEYSQLEKTFARRTFDESGDYTVRQFPIEVRDYRNNYRGTWANQKSYIRGDVVLINNTTFYTCTADHNSASSGTFTQDPNYNKWIEDSNPLINFGRYEGLTYSADINGEIKPLTTKLSLSVEPGKAYVKGYEIEKVATQYLTLNKARTYSPGKETYSFDASPGNWILIDNVYGVPDLSTFKTINLYKQLGTNGNAGTTLVGTARAWQIQYHDQDGPTSVGTYGDANGKRYKLFLFDIKMNAGYDFKSHVKWLYSDSSGTGADFSASVSPTLESINGLIKTATFSSPNTTITATDSTFILDLVVGDYIYAGGTNVWRVTAINSISEIVVSGNASTLSAANKIYKVTASLNDPSKVSPLFSIPSYAVKSANNLTYSFYKSSDVTISSGVSVSPIAASGYVFGASTDTTNYILINKTTGAYYKPGDFTISGAGTDQITIANAVAGPVVDGVYTLVYCLSRASGSVGRTKTLTTRTDTVTLSSGKANLTKSDFFEIISIYDGSTNVTTKFIFDNGQTSSFYGIPSIQTTDSNLQSSTVTVKYQYFEHSVSGDYFTVDSYGVGSGVNQEELTRLQISTVDFRPMKTGSGDTDWLSPIIPKYGELASVQYDYYYGRIDKLSIDFSGKFIITEGIPSNDPDAPDSPTNAMDLYTLEIEPYTFTSSYGVVAKKVENKRYTMRDIGKLENRIKNLEYYSSLSSLEQNTANLKSYDNYGYERPQSGFIVDGFNGQGVGDAVSNDWQASIDMVNSELRPKSTQNQISLHEIVSSNLNRSSKNYEVNGDIVTLKIQEKVPLVKQLRASKSEAVNPFDIYTWKGDIDIIPWSDTWFETQNRPDIIINDNHQYDALVAKAEKDGVLTTVWNAPQLIWSGVPRTSTTTYQGFRTAGDGGAWLDQQFGNVSYRGGWWRREVTVQETLTDQLWQTTGIRTFIESRTDYTTISDKVVSTELIPYMRTRTIVFRARALKPLTRMYSFFDETNVDGYVIPSKRIVVTPKTGTTMYDYNLNSNVGTNINNSARKIDDVVTSAYSYGEVLIEYMQVGAGSPTATGLTCVAVGQETTNLTGTGLVNLVYIENLKKVVNGSSVTPTFGVASGNTTYWLQGEFDDSKKIIVNTTSVLNSSGIGSGTYSTSELKTTYSGQLFGTFKIPNNNSLKFRTGSREFRVTDNSSNNRKEEATAADAVFESRGILETREKTILATKTAKLATEQVQKDPVAVVNTSNRSVVSDTGWYDPLAQTFLVDVKGGCLVTDVDLYFQQKPTAGKDPDVPVRLEIRTVVNGYPGQAVLPYSRVTLDASKVNVDSTKASAATNFKFQAPIYLQEGVEYCLCVFSDSSKYRVWISETGLADVGGAGLIATQPYAGVLFKSQNASTWTADQTQDLKFQLNRAKFTSGTGTSATAVLELQNQHITSAIPYNVAQIDVNNVVVSGTTLTSMLSSNNSTAQSIPLGNNVMFDTQQTVNTYTTENTNGYPSIKTSLVLSTEKENLSPIIDLSRCTATIVKNIIDNDTPETGDYENVSSGGTALAKYITKSIKLNDPATTLRIVFDNNTPNAADYDIYYKIGNKGDSDFELNEFTRVTQDNPYVTKYKKSNKSENPRQFTESEFVLENLPAFSQVRVKLVMKSSNTSKVPRFKDLRVIAYA